MSSSSGQLAARVRRRAARHLREVYYRHGYARDFPGKQRAVQLLSAWESADGRGDVPKGHEAWDDQYTKGGWEFLDGINEVPHYAVTVGYSHFFKPGASVLDVGCGHGVLHDHYLRAGYSRYLGVDVSNVAIRQFAERVSGPVEAVAADAETFTPDGTFDVIAFNESITYFVEPEATYARYLQFLNPGGLVIVSCHQQSARARAIQQVLLDAYPVQADATITSGANSWRVVVFKAG